MAAKQSFAPSLCILIPLTGSLVDGLSQGLYVTPVMYKSDGSAGIDPANAFTLGIICPNCQCDRIARIDYAGMAGGNNSVMACHWCAMNGTSVAGAVRPCGYVEEITPTQGKLKDKKILIGRDDWKREMDHFEQEARGQHMEERGKR